MSYTINNADGTALVTVPDTQLNTQYGITLIGRNYSGYGVFLNDNFVVLMENFASPTAPASPLTGQLWFNTATKKIQVWQGSLWKTLAFSTTVGSAPPANNGVLVGDLWWDTTNDQLNVWGGQTLYSGNVAVTSTGNIVTVNFSTAGIVSGDTVTHANVNPYNVPTVTQILNSSQVQLNTSLWVGMNEAISFSQGQGWNTIGPGYTKGQGLTGVIPSTVVDTVGTNHSVGIMYNNGVPSTILSGDVAFTPAPNNAIPGFPVIYPGVQTRNVSNTLINKTIQATTVGSSGQTTLTLNSVYDLRVGDYYTSYLNNGAVSVGLGSLVSITNLFPNNVVTISTATQVWAGNIVTFQRGLGPVGQFTGTSTNSLTLGGNAPDSYALLAVDNEFLGNLTVDGNINLGGSIVFEQDNIAISNSYTAGNIQLVVNANNYNNQSTNFPGLPALTVNGANGIVSVALDPISDPDVATRRYVNNSQGTALAAITANVNTLLGTTASLRTFSAVSATANSLAASLATLSADNALKPYTNNTVLTGTPVAPTPTDGTNTTQIATTAFVTNAVGTLSTTVNTNLTTNYAPLVSPVLTGAPKAPTATAGDSTANIATTAFVTTAVGTLQATINTALTNYMPLVGGLFSGVISGPTAPAGDSTTKLATTAFVTSAVTLANTAAFANLATTNSTLNALAVNVSTNYAPLVSPALTGSPTAPTFATPTSNTAIATTAFVQNLFNAYVPGTYAPLASPALTGNPTAPTPTEGDNDTSIATTAFVTTAVATANTAIQANLVAVQNQLALRANIASPSFTGTPLAPTAGPGTNTTQIATTAFVINAINPFITATNASLTYAPLVSPTLSGIPVAPTAAYTTNTTQIATTAFVANAIASPNSLWQGSAKFVSSSAPTSGQGANGDIWFQV